jgi:hypothetical protein
MFTIALILLIVGAIVLFVYAFVQPLASNDGHQLLSK